MVWMNKVRNPKVHTTLSIDLDDINWARNNFINLSQLLRMAIIRRRGELQKEVDLNEREFNVHQEVKKI